MIDGNKAWMLPAISFAMSVFIMGGCGAPNDNELEQYVNRFHEEAVARKANVPVMMFSVRFHGLSVDCTEAAICISELTWITMQEDEKERLVFSLLGDVLLGKTIDDKFSRMHYKAYRDEILDELFRL